MPVNVMAGGGRLGIDFMIIGVRPLRDSLRFHVVVKRNINRTLAWQSDRPRMNRIYLLSGRKQFKLVDLGGVFVENVTHAAPGNNYEGWLEFERPPGTDFHPGVSGY